MCNVCCVLFVARHLNAPDIRAKHVLELGSSGIGVGPLLRGWQPAEYVGVDLGPGPGVEVVCNAEDLETTFDANRFDVVVSTEMLEHVRDWRRVVDGIKWVCKPGGRVVLTTRSLGFGFHGAPYDYWRYEPSDMDRIFSDFEGVRIESDLQDPGVFVMGTKPVADYVPVDLSTFDLYSMVAGRRTRTVPPPGTLNEGQPVWERRWRTSVRAITETLRGRPPGLKFRTGGVE